MSLTIKVIIAAGLATYCSAIPTLSFATRGRRGRLGRTAEPPFRGPASRPGRRLLQKALRSPQDWKTTSSAMRRV